LFACATKIDKWKNKQSPVSQVSAGPPSADRTSSEFDASIIIETVRDDHTFDSEPKKQKIEKTKCTAGNAAPSAEIQHNPEPTWTYRKPRVEESNNSVAGSGESPNRGRYKKRLRKYTYRQYKKKLAYENRRR